MADSGPHNAMCAGAGANTECDCDCAGAMHAVLTTGGVPSASRVTDRAKRFAKANGNPVVENDGAGGTVTSRERGRRLPPTIAARLDQIVAGMPQTRTEWDALVPRDSVGLPKLQQRQAEIEARQKELSDQIAEVYGKAQRAEWERMAGHSRNYTYETRMKRGEAAADKAVEQLRKEFSDLTTEIVSVEGKIRAFSPAAGGSIDWPTDPATGRAMPPPAMNRHLDEVLEVGQQVIAHAKTEADKDPEIRAARERRARYEQIYDAYNQQANALWIARSNEELTQAEYDRKVTLLRAEIPEAKEKAGIADYNPHNERKLIARREAEILRELIATVRPMGNAHHPRVEEIPKGSTAVNAGDGARDDARERLERAEGWFPDDWVQESGRRPIGLTSSDRAYYYDRGMLGGNLSMPSPARDAMRYNGGFADYTDEVTVHELGHRMEASVPGLTAMEFTFVRRRSTNDRGELEEVQKMSKLTGSTAYDDHEVAFKDRWKNAYAGKTYEARGGLRPDREAWEVFQVGLQDTFGRSGTRYDTGDELQAFVVGAMLTLGRRR